MKDTPEMIGSWLDNGLVKFDADTHTYEVWGAVVPSVTQIVAPLGKDYDEPDDMNEGAIDAATERGTALHAYIAWRLQGGAPEDFELPDAYCDYADAVDQFLAEHSIDPLLIETPLGMPGVCAGTPDLVCTFDGADAVLDWKFVSQVAKTKVAAQLAGYKILCDYNELPVDKLIAVQFLPTGYRLYPVGVSGATNAFNTCQQLYELIRRKHPRGRIFEEEAKNESV